MIVYCTYSNNEFNLQVRHPNVVQFLGAGQLHDGSGFLVTEFLPLGSLRRVLDHQVVDWPLKLVGVVLCCQVVVCELL